MINPSGITNHATQRCSQRGISRDDISLIHLVGTCVPDGVFVRKKDCEELARNLRRLAGKIERLKGTLLVFNENLMITGYHARPGKAQKLLRRTPDRDQEN